MTGQSVGFGVALREQLGWFWQRMRTWIVIVAVLVSATASWIVSEIPAGEGFLSIVVFGAAFHPMLVLIALSWAMSAWRDDPPKDRQYFWLHPSSRTGHTIARTLAGFIWLLAVVAVIIATVLITATLVHDDVMLGSATFWSFVLGGITLAYLAGSIAPVLSDRPGIWVTGIIAIVLIADIIATIREIEWLEKVTNAFKDHPLSFLAALNGPSVEAMRMLQAQHPGAGQLPMERIADATPGSALLIWLPVTLILFLGAVRLSRPR